MKKKERKKGFTLVELLVVIAIMGILMAAAAPKYSGMVNKANKIQNQAYAREIINYIEIYNAEHVNGKIAEETTTAKLTTDNVIKDDDFIKAVVNFKNSGGTDDKTIEQIRKIANGTAEVKQEEEATNGE